MRDSEKYFLLNKRSDFEKGFLQNLIWDGQGLRLQNPQRGERGVFLSPVLDCLEQETIWHRGIIEGESLGDSSIVFQFYATDSPYITDQHGTMWKLEEYLTKDVPLWEKEQAFLPFLVEKRQNPQDILLHNLKGRYVWFEIQLFGQGDLSPMVKRVQLSFPKRSWTQYLPELYQGESQNFLERYLGIFQSLYEDLDKNIREVSAYLEIDTADEEFLNWLAQWLGVEGGYLWEQENLRELLHCAMDLYSIKGTVESLKQIIQLKTGQCPYVVEQYEIAPFQKDISHTKLLRQLYGEYPNMLTVCLPNRVVPSNRMYQTIIKLIETVKPAQVEINLVLLKPYIFLDSYSYLGINSVLGQYQPLQLDGQSAVPLTTVGGLEERTESM